MNIQNPNRFPSLSKLSVAILEHIVKPIIGDDAIREIKSPVLERELRDQLMHVLVISESRFIRECNDEITREAILSLPLSDLPSVVDAVREFYNRPNDPALEQVMLTQLKSTLPKVPVQRIEDSVSQYISILRSEFANLSAEIRDKLQTHSLLAIAKSTTEIAASLKIDEGNNAWAIKRDGSVSSESDDITNFTQLAQAIWEPLGKSGKAFLSFGPNSGAESAAPVRWDLKIWGEAKKDIIIPNNKIIRSLIEKYFHLVPTEYKVIFEQMLAHIYALDLLQK